MIYRFFRQAALLAAGFSSSLLGQSLFLSSGSGSPGSSASVALTVSSGGAQLAAVQWTFAYSAADIAGFQVAASPAMAAAGKSLNCAGTAAAYTCLAYGLNTSAIPDGPLATIVVTIAPGGRNSSISVTGAMGVSPVGDALPLADASSTVSVILLPVAGSLSCSPGSLNSGGSAVCTVMLSAAGTTAQSVTLHSTSALLQVPSSILVPAGAVSATFNVTAASIASDQTASITAALNGSSQNAVVSLFAPPPPLLSLQCAAAALISLASTTCTITLASPARTGGAAVSVKSSSPLLSVPATVTVPPGAVSASFTASAGTLSAAQNAVITAMLSGSSRTTGMSLATPGSLTSLACSPMAILPGAGGSCTVSLSSSVSTPVAIALASTNAGLQSPSSLTIAPGSTSSTFNFSTTAGLTGWMILSASYGGVRRSVSFTINADPNAISVSFASPASAARIGGKVAVAANALTNSAISNVQFSVDGANLSGSATVSGSSIAMQWDSTAVPNGVHTLAVAASNSGGGSATSAVSITVDNPVPPVVTAVAAGAITASGATITWTTDHGSDSQVAYGLTSGYGFTSLLDTTLATSHSVTLAGLSASTVYHFQVRTRDGLGLSTASSDVTFTTIAAGPQILLQLHTDETELSAGLTNGSIITPSIGPPGFTGTVVVRPGGTAAFAPAQSGNGVYFQNCCTGTANAYYKFPGPAVGSLFDVKQGEISFSLKSRYSFAQRLTFSSYRTVFDVRDNESDHLFYFLTQASNGWLAFTYRVGSTTTQFYFVPVGKEDTLFGNGVVLNVRIVWDGSTSKLYLNDVQVQSSPNPKATPNWTALSNFDLGAWEYSTYCGYNSSDDVIDEFTVTRGH